jgi:DNA-directed RNA polymerase specialized sigma24 family protein
MSAEIGSENPSFTDLIHRVRSGDAEAAAEIVRRFEPEIRRRIRTWIRLYGTELRPVFESMDVCQSIMSEFFLRVSAGLYDLDEPKQVLGLLAAMTRNKLRVLSRDQRRQRRDVRRNEPLGEGSRAGVASDETPSRIVAGRELLREFQARLTDEERMVAELRSENTGWAEIAGKVGGTPEGRRKQYTRAVDRIARELGLGEPGDVS